MLYGWRRIAGSYRVWRIEKQQGQGQISNIQQGMANDEVKNWHSVYGRVYDDCLCLLVLYGYRVGMAHPCIMYFTVTV